MKNLSFTFLITFIFLLANPHLTRGSDEGNLLPFHLPHVLDGQWWRILTASFHHASWGHLFFGFLTTLGFLLMIPFRERAAVYFAGAFGSLLLPLLLTPATHNHLISGVSGVTHGLVVACVWPTLKSDYLPERIISWASLIFVYLKVTYESFTGTLVDFGLVSGFITGFCKDSHLGGVLGISLYCGIQSLWKNVTHPSPQLSGSNTQPTS